MKRCVDRVVSRMHRRIATGMCNCYISYIHIYSIFVLARLKPPKLTLALMTRVKKKTDITQIGHEPKLVKTKVDALHSIK